MTDLVIRGGTVATDQDVFEADVAVSGGKIEAVGPSLPRAQREIDARGKLVLPGGVDSHTHIEQISSAGVMTADDFHSATVSAAFGGTTTVISFCAQHRNDSIPVVLEGRFQGDTFASDRIMVKHSEDYIAKHPTRVTTAPTTP